MPIITFLPSGKKVEVRRGRTILDISKEEKEGVYYQCDGSCICGTCLVLLEEGEENLTPIEAGEEHHLDLSELEGKKVRLACQARILGDVTIRLYEGE